MEQNTQGRGVARKRFWLLLDYQANTEHVRRCLWDRSLSYAGDLKEEKSCKPGPEPGVWEEQVHSRPQGASVSGVGEHRGSQAFHLITGPLALFHFLPSPSAPFTPSSLALFHYRAINAAFHSHSFFRDPCGIAHSPPKLDLNVDPLAGTSCMLASY